jgi:hypothetical protein
VELLGHLTVKADSDGGPEGILHGNHDAVPRVYRTAQSIKESSIRRKTA